MAGKEDIVTRIAHKSGLTKKATYKLMEAFKDVLTETILKTIKIHPRKTTYLRTFLTVQILQILLLRFFLLIHRFLMLIGVRNLCFFDYLSAIY